MSVRGQVVPEVQAGGRVKESAEARMERQSRERWQFIEVLRRAGNVVVEEVKFHPERKWRADLYLPDHEILIEIEGLNGRHQSMAGFRADLEKYGEAFAMGYDVLRVSRQMVADGTALELLARRGVSVEANDGQG